MIYLIILSEDNDKVGGVLEFFAYTSYIKNYIIHTNHSFFISTDENIDLDDFWNKLVKK